MAFYSLVFFGFMPLGALGAGVMADIIGAPITVAVGGAGMLLMAIAVFVFFPQIRAEE